MFFLNVGLLEREWDAIMVQEGPTCETDKVETVEGGHLWCVAASRERPRSTAILLHSKLAIESVSTIVVEAAQVHGTIDAKLVKKDSPEISKLRESR